MYNPFSLCAGQPEPNSQKGLNILSGSVQEIPRVAVPAPCEAPDTAVYCLQRVLVSTVQISMLEMLCNKTAGTPERVTAVLISAACTLLFLN